MGEDNVIQKSIPLRVLAEQNGLLIGTAVAIDPLRTEPRYRETLAREFNIVTPENVMKFELIHPEPNRYEFTPGDEIVNFATQHKIQVRGHTLSWHWQLPKWLTERGFTSDEVNTVLHNHINTVVSHYRGKLAIWDVVNEAVDDNANLRDTIWLKSIGPEYINLSFKWAYETDPTVKLFYNDYGAETINPKSDAIYRLIENMLAQNVPIHGLGLQMHISTDVYPDPEEVRKNIERFIALGIEVHITEMDVRVNNSATDVELERQVKIYRDIVTVCKSVQGCTAVIFWGFTDKHSWVPQFFPGCGRALLFTETYLPKPTYFTVTEVL